MKMGANPLARRAAGVREPGIAGEPRVEERTGARREDEIFDQDVAWLLRQRQRQPLDFASRSVDLRPMHKATPRKLHAIEDHEVIGHVQKPEIARVGKKIGLHDRDAFAGRPRFARARITAGS